MSDDLNERIHRAAGLWHEAKHVEQCEGPLGWSCEGSTDAERLARALLAALEAKA